jgi:hypothetical protein
LAIDDLYLYSNNAVLKPTTTQPFVATADKIEATCTGNGFNQLTWDSFEGKETGTYEVQKFTKDAWRTVEVVAVEEGRALYEWKDAAPILGENLYRIVAVDATKTERSEPSEIAATDCTVDASSFVVYPNPFRDQITLQFHAPMTALLPYRITNTLGQVLYDGTFQAQEGNNSFILPIERLPQGMYLLHTQGKMVKLIKN